MSGELELGEQSVCSPPWSGIIVFSPSLDCKNLSLPACLLNVNLMHHLNLRNQKGDAKTKYSNYCKRVAQTGNC